MTAEEMINSKYTEFEDLGNGNIWVNIENLMIEFAKLKVTEALKEVNDKAMIELSKDWIRKTETIRPGDLISPINIKINEESILNAYDLNNIK